MTTYLGASVLAQAGVFVQRNPLGRYQPLNPRRDLREFSSDGFLWGGGAATPGHTRLALAILADHLGPDGGAEALALAPAFAAATIARLPSGSWTLDTEEIEEAVALLRDDPVGFTP